MKVDDTHGTGAPAGATPPAAVQGGTPAVVQPASNTTNTAAPSGIMAINPDANTRAPGSPQMLSPNFSEAPLIFLQDITHEFKENVGFFYLTYNIPKGTICGMIGPSGCGKTTTVRLMTGLLKPDKGRISVLGREPMKFNSRTREKIGYLPQHFVLYPDLTVWENLSFAASLYGMGYLSRRKRMKDLLDFVELSDARNRLGSNLSGGMQRRLELACALVHNPELIFADEPTAGIDPVLRSKFWDYFRNLRADGRTLFVTTQYVGEAAYCDYVIVMRAGRIIDFDTPNNLRRKVIGGEAIVLEVDPAAIRDAAKIVDSHPAVNFIRRSPDRPGVFYAYTNDAGTTIPILLNILSNENHIPVHKAEEYQPSFDDVFVQLMEHAGQNHV